MMCHKIKDFDGGLLEIFEETKKDSGVGHRICVGIHAESRPCLCIHRSLLYEILHLRLGFLCSRDSLKMIFHKNKDFDGWVL